MKSTACDPSSKAAASHHYRRHTNAADDDDHHNDHINDTSDVDYTEVVRNSGGGVGSGSDGNMAGNLVKWWKHKILGGYKQFSGKHQLSGEPSHRTLLGNCRWPLMRARVCVSGF